jgi:hypothetical protein
VPACGQDVVDHVTTAAAEWDAVIGFDERRLLAAIGAAALVRPQELLPVLDADVLAARGRAPAMSS